MNLYRLDTEPLGLTFGYFIPGDGAYDRLPRDCRPDCPFGVLLERRFPAELCYQGGPIGDFMEGIGILLARTEVAHDLERSFRGVEVRRIVYAPAKRGECRKYQGPELVELWPLRRIEISRATATVKVDSICPLCDREFLRLDGVELEAGEVKVGDRYERMPPQPRSEGGGIQIRFEYLGEDDIFSYDDFFICTERVREHILSRGYTNARFIEYGDVLS